MIDIDSEDFKELERRCKNHVPPYDPERVIQLANALRKMIVKRKHYADGSYESFVTCYKSKKMHRQRVRIRERDF